ncbi:MAG: hypothetical protein KDE14_04245 [Rhodobacteraceae bacterium]|nr:hypothetical protein [Paracoccaceae bacterium]
MAKLKTDRPTYAVDAIPSDIKDAVFLGNPMLDNLVSSMIAMGTELWATKRRLKVVEALMAEKGVTNEMIEQFVPSEAQTAAWEADRDRFIDLTFGPLANPGTTGMSADFPKRGNGV